MLSSEPIPTNSAAPARRRWRLSTVAFLAAGLSVCSAALVVYTLSDDQPKKPVEPPVGATWSYEAVFPNWPKDKKPDFVIIITGQTYGYLQKCGCTDPQKGGLERRFNFIDGFKAHGIETVPLDIGDVSPHLTTDEFRLHPQQALLKYKTVMSAMKEMGYKAVAVGKEDFKLGLLSALSEYSLQPGNEYPRVLAANIQNKETEFPAAKGGSTLHDFDMIETKSKINLGVVGIVGDPIINEVKTIDKNISFAPNSAKVLTDTVLTMMKGPKKPNVAVLLYNGPHEIPDPKKPEGPPIKLAERAARAFPQFRVVACLTAESEPPADAEIITDKDNPKLNTLLVRIGHKGQYVGVIGVFRDGKGGVDLKYQRVTMSPQFETPEGKEKENKALHELENYSRLVKARDFLSRQQKSNHPLQVGAKGYTFIGSAACMTCHKDHGDAWQVFAGSKHAQAYNALQNIAKKPELRNYDPECIRCHTVGYDYNSGFVNTDKTPQLINVGCESCHGPGSMHAAQPNNKKFALELSPWKANGAGQLPPLAKFKEFNEQKGKPDKEIFTPAEKNFINLVDRTCQKCHNHENDPGFKFEAFWPKIAHSKAAAPKQVPVVPNAAPVKKGDDPKTPDE